MASPNHPKFQDHMASLDCSRSREVTEPRGPRKASSTRQKTSPTKARDPTSDKGKDDVQRERDTIRGRGAVATSVTLGSDPNPGAERTEWLATVGWLFAKPHDAGGAVVGSPSTTTREQSQGLAGWMPPPPPVLPAMPGESRKKAIEQLFDYLADKPEEWPQVQGDMVWWRDVFLRR